METNTTATDGPSRPVSSVAICCVSLAAGATAISIAMAALAAADIGGTGPEKALWAAVGIIAVLGAHLLPAASRGAPPRLRAMAWIIWASSMAYVAISHTGYFMSAQREAGDRRAEQIIAPEENTSPRRAESTILQEEAKARSELTKLAASNCQECIWVRTRVTVIETKIRALQSEAEEARDAQAVRNLTARAREERRADPVTLALVTLLGADKKLVALAPAVMFAVILDGLASLCWLLAIQGRDPPRSSGAVTVTTVTPSCAAPVVTTVMPETHGVAAPPVPSMTLVSGEGQSAKGVSGPMRTAPSFPALVASARNAVAAGSIKPTVRGVQVHLACAQKTASAVCKALRTPA